MARIKAIKSYLTRPAVGWTVLSLGGLGIIIGIVSVVGFNFSLAATGTEAFCVSCHEMHAQPFRTLQQTAHFKNRIGNTASCSDCHVPHEFIPKMIRKIEAAREVYGHLLGTIDTPEKYAAHLEVMKTREINRLRANDSQECRNCHNVERTDFSLQSAKAQEYHLAVEHNQKTCIDCHQGIAHDYSQAGSLPARP
jgi:cytochrome c-type protein NapC